VVTVVRDAEGDFDRLVDRRGVATESAARDGPR
jgi:hypothetical protein